MEDLLAAVERDRAFRRAPEFVSEPRARTDVPSDVPRVAARSDARHETEASTETAATRTGAAARSMDRPRRDRFVFAVAAIAAARFGRVTTRWCRRLLRASRAYLSVCRRGSR